MSGIVGILRLDGAPVDAALLRRMTEFLAFRAPDGSGVWSEGVVGLGHALLRTTVEDERQPGTLDGQLWITADARIDGQEELRGKLEAKGRAVAASATDAELILAAYAVWEQGCLEHLLGDFAFAVWDGCRRKLFCARDPLGAKPFYYAEVGGSLIFSNTLDCLRLHADVSDELNDLAVADFLLFGFNQEPTTTAFADIRRLPPAHTLTWSEGALRVARYWTLPVESVIRYKRDAEYVEHFQHLFRSAVADRLRSQSAGVLMSGGMDSTSVASVAKQVLVGRAAPFDLRAYTVDYSPLFDDSEGHYAPMVAQALDIPIHFLSGANCALYEGRENLHKPEPLHEPLAILQVRQLQQAAAQSSVVLSGDGGDVILHAQSWPYLVGLFKRWHWGRLAGEFGGYILSHGKIPPLLGGFRARWKRWLGRAEPALEYPGWLNRDLESRLNLRARWEEYKREPPPAHPTHPRADQVLRGRYWPFAFEMEDAGVTGVPVEVRRPLFDLRLVRYALRLPPLPWCADKQLLRVAMRGMLPEPVRRRPKTPLGGDPVFLLWQRQAGRTVSPPANDLVARYVDVERIPPFAGNESIVEVWLNLTPLSLKYWLQEAIMEYKNRRTLGGTS